MTFKKFFFLQDPSFLEEKHWALAQTEILKNRFEILIAHLIFLCSA